MNKEEKLYEVLGELLYTVAKADGVIQEEERAALKKLFKRHPLGNEILWSFEYEESKNSTIEDIYNKVINYCHSYGPTPVYEEFINSMTIIAEAAEGINTNESRIINSFSKDLLKRFQLDADKSSNFRKS